MNPSGMNSQTMNAFEGQQHQILGSNNAQPNFVNSTVYGGDVRRSFSHGNQMNNNLGANQYHSTGSHTEGGSRVVTQQGGYTAGAPAEIRRSVRRSNRGVSYGGPNV